MGLAIQMVATVAMARLLTPTDFGLVAIVTTFSLLISNFGVNGFTEAIVQRPEIDEKIVSNIFWINVASGVALTAGFAAAGTLMAQVYGNPHVKYVAMGMSLTILIGSFSVVHIALLKRAMQFSSVSFNQIVARFVSVVVAIVLGWMGWGYWALVSGSIALSLVTTMSAWVMCRWIPRAPSYVPGTMSMARFALNVYGRFSVNYMSRNMDNFVVGLWFSPQSLGFYKKAYDLFALSASQLIAPLTSVAVSTLSRLSGDSEQYRRYLLNALGVVAFVGMALGANLTLVGPDLIRLLLGPGWETAGRIFMFFGPGVGMMMLYATHGWIHLSIGRADRWLRWGILECVLTASLFFAGSFWGVEGIAAAWTCSFWLLMLPALWYAGQPINFSPRSVVSVVWRYIVAGLVAGLSSAAIIRSVSFLAHSTDSFSIFLRILTASVLFTILYLLAIVALYGGSPRRIYEIVGLLQEVLPFRKNRKSVPIGPRADATGT
jgi:PST family polysaccharide transporter